MRFILLTPPKTLPDEITLLNTFFEQGLPILHLHKPDYDVSQLQEYLDQIASEWHPKIVLHAYPPNLASHHPLNDIQANIKGIHLPEQVRMEAMPLPDKFKVISTSFHHLNDLLACEGEYEYLFISPIFNSISKQGYQAAFELDDLAHAMSQSKYPVIGMGGIAADKMQVVKDLGFAGVGVLGGVWQSDTPAETLNQLMAL